jgi:hypothetical protein
MKYLIAFAFVIVCVILSILIHWTWDAIKRRR